MERFYVCRHYMKWKGQLYKKGDLLPENFTEHDRVRSIYSSRIARGEFPEAPATPTAQTPLGQSQPPLPNTTTPLISAKKTQQVDNSKKGTIKVGPKPSVAAPTGAPKG